MSMTSFLLNRESTREFKNKELKSSTIDSIENIILEIKSEIREEDSIDFKLIKDGSLLFNKLKDLGGYAGVMVESPSYISLATGEKPGDKLYGAYYMEDLITRLNGLNLGTCWVSLAGVPEEKKLELLGPGVDFLLAVGEKKLKNPFAKEVFSERKEIKDIVFEHRLGDEVDLDILEERGLLDVFYYIRFAPSTKNLQPWRFVIEEDRVVLYLEKDVVENYGLTDGGIVMYYFRQLASMINITSEWRLGDFKEKDGCLEIGEIHI